MITGWLDERRSAEIIFEVEDRVELLDILTVKHDCDILLHSVVGTWTRLDSPALDRVFEEIAGYVTLS